MKRTLLFIVCLLCISAVYATDISRLEPACWWVGMKNPELQIMVYGKNIACLLYTSDAADEAKRV